MSIISVSAIEAIIDFYEDSGEDEVSEQAREEIEGIKGRIENLEAQVKWFEGLFTSLHEKVSATLDRSWTSYSVPPQFDKDGVQDA